ASKDGEELDQVTGNAGDEISERIAAVRETELLYGEQSLLAIYGPMLVHICHSPHKFKNKTSYCREQAIYEVRRHQSVLKIICLAVKHHGHSMAAQVAIMQNLQFYEHLAEPMADCITVLANEFDHAQLGDELLREIAVKTFNAQDKKGPRVFARFLVRFVELAPRSILKQLSLLQEQLDSESYPIHIALVEIIGHLIRELAEAGDKEEQRQPRKQIIGLYEPLRVRRIKKMVHLIWMKDNTSTSEERNEIKGIRSRLLDCYKKIYFNPLPDLSPKEQVNRISKNMIE
ncbi:hypothetical protein DXG01_011012, partial [Tephrocybe rancida]